MLLSGLFGNETTEKVLFFLENYNCGYPSQIATTFRLPVSQIQRQLERLEREGIISSRLIGKTREYSWNPRFVFLKQLRNLLAAAIDYLPDEYQEKYFRQRTRPRRKGKPLK